MFTALGPFSLCHINIMYTRFFISLCYVQGTIEYLICNPKKDKKENPNKQHKEDFNDVFLV